MKRYAVLLLIPFLLVGCKKVTPEEKLGQEVILMLEAADNKGKTKDLENRLDRDFLHAMGLTAEDYIAAQAEFVGEEKTKNTYEMTGIKEIEPGVYRMDLKLYREQKDRKSEESMQVIIKKTDKDWTFTPMDLVKPYVLKPNDKKEYFHVTVPFVAERSDGQTYVLDLSNNSEELKFYVMENTTVEVETTEGSYTAEIKELELLPGESKRTNLFIEKAAGEPKKITFWKMADEQRYFDYSVVLEIKEPPTTKE